MVLFPMNLSHHFHQMNIIIFGIQFCKYIWHDHHPMFCCEAMNLNCCTPLQKKEKKKNKKNIVCCGKETIVSIFSLL